MGARVTGEPEPGADAVKDVVGKALAGFDALMAATLAGSDPRKYHIVSNLCKAASTVKRDFATGIGAFNALEEEDPYAQATGFRRVRHLGENPFGEEHNVMREIFTVAQPVLAAVARQAESLARKAEMDELDRLLRVRSSLLKAKKSVSSVDARIEKLTAAKAEEKPDGPPMVPADVARRHLAPPALGEGDEARGREAIAIRVCRDDDLALEGG